MSATTNPSLSSLPQNGYVEGVYSLINPQIGTTRTGKPYLKCILRDATGEVVSRQWSFEESRLEPIQATGFVSVAGHTQVYNGQVQLILEQIDAVEVSDDQLASLLPTTAKNIATMDAELRKIIGSMKHPAMAALAQIFLEDDDLMARFRRAPAAASVHHAWIGGLLEHTLQLLELADVMLPLYPGLNRDLVLMGLFLHDIGKTSELTWEKGFEYTTDGNLIGHVVRGAIWLQFKAAVAAKQSGKRLPGEALCALQHIILSHHGEPEYGAAKVPATPEAIFVSMLDNLDAKTQIALTAAARDSTDLVGAFSEKIWALGTRVYRPDPLAKPRSPKPAKPAPPPRGESSRPRQRRGGSGTGSGKSARERRPEATSGGTGSREQKPAPQDRAAAPTPAPPVPPPVDAPAAAPPAAPPAAPVPPASPASPAAPVSPGQPASQPSAVPEPAPTTPAVGHDAPAAPAPVAEPAGESKTLFETKPPAEPAPSSGSEGAEQGG